MRVPVEWLNSYLDRPLGTQEMAAALERAGVEVESIESAPELDERIVVGRVLKVRPHPNADRLRVAKVDLGSEQRTIVCGAPNLEEGQLVAVAQVGSVLPDGTKLEAAELRGVTSEGMICSARELGRGDDHEGIMVLSEDAEIGAPAQNALGVYDVIDTTTAANRWDLNGLAGLAREVAAHAGAGLQLGVEDVDRGTGESVEVQVENRDLVPRYMVAKLAVDASKPSPRWLQQRLAGAGVRPISIVVDITNYVLLEQGQPLHAFDAGRVELPIVVRQAHGGEAITTLDGTRRELGGADLVIADANGAIAIAGVMGGKDSEVSAKTTTIYLEAATFAPAGVRHIAKRHTLRTDASARFERGIPVLAAEVGLLRAIKLLQELADGELQGAIADTQPVPVAHSIATQVSRISSRLGIELSGQRMSEELMKLGIATELESDNEVMAEVPWWRPDLRLGDDIAEEVMKLVGYDALPATLPEWQPTELRFDTRWQPLWQARSALLSLGLFEVGTYSFISAKQITQLHRDLSSFLQLLNPLSREQEYLRSDLLPSLLHVAERNRTYGKQFGVFEFSKVYISKGEGELPDEPTHLGVLARSQANGYASVKSALDRLARIHNVPLELEVSDSGAGMAAAVVYPQRSALIKVGGRVIGWIAQLHPALANSTKLGGELGYLELDWEAFSAASQPVTYRQPSRFPSVSRDLSLLVERTVSWQQLAATLPEHQVRFLSDYYGSDVPIDKKGVALRVTFREPDRTLTDAEVEERMKTLVAKLHQAVGAQLRS